MNWLNEISSKCFHDMSKQMKMLISIVVVGVVFGVLLKCCNMGDRRFKPETYFDTTNEAELAMAKAIYDGSTRRVKKHIKSGNVDINKPGKLGFTYLLYALYGNQYDVAKVLIENGADPNRLCKVRFPGGAEELTPLSVVCGHAWYSMKYYKLLVEHGANINDPDMPALNICIIMSGKDQKKVRYLIDSGADLHLTYGGDTPMECAVTSRHLELVDLLWEYDATPLITKENGNNLAWMLQEVVEKRLGTQEYIDHAKAIMKRLEGLGVEFPVTQSLQAITKKIRILWLSKKRSEEKFGSMEWLNEITSKVEEALNASVAYSEQTCGALLENVNPHSYTDSVGWIGYYGRKCQYSHTSMNESIEQFINFFKGIIPKISVITSLYKYETDSEAWRLLKDSEWDVVRKMSSVVMYNDGDVAGHCFFILEALDLIAYPHDDTGFGFISNASNHNSAAIVKELFEGLDTNKFMYELQIS